MANNGKRITSWWNQEVKDGIHAKKVAYKVWIQNKANFFHSRCAEAQKSVALEIKNTRNPVLGEFLS